MKYFTKKIDQYLAYWIGPDTCLTWQDIEDRFYLFVMSIHHFSPLLRDKTRSVNDPDLVNLPPQVQEREVNKRTCRNPKTYDKDNFIEKVSRALKRKHPDWNEQYIDEQVQKLAEKAMFMLDALHYMRGFPLRFAEGCSLL